MSEQKNPTTIPLVEPQSPFPTRSPGGIDGNNPRGETAVCPTGLTDAGLQLPHEVPTSDAGPEPGDVDARKVHGEFEVEHLEARQGADEE